jgi:hypothetical protein
MSTHLKAWLGYVFAVLVILAVVYAQSGALKG